MKSGTFFRNCIIGISCSLFFSSCCCFGTKGINFDMRKTIVEEGVNSFSVEPTDNSYRGSDKTANDTLYVSLPGEEQIK